MLQQLHDGVRYFDLRVCARHQGFDGELWIVHSMFSLPLREVVEAVATFIEENPYEVVILDLNHLYCMGEREHMVCLRLFQDILGDHIASSDLGPNATLQKFWDAGQQVSRSLSDYFSPLGYI